MEISIRSITRTAPLIAGDRCEDAPLVCPGDAVEIASLPPSYSHRTRLEGTDLHGRKTTIVYCNEDVRGAAVRLLTGKSR